jgi:hypothetical protein
VQPRMGIKRRSILVVYVCLECATNSTLPCSLLPLVPVVSATVFLSWSMLDWSRGFCALVFRVSQVRGTSTNLSGTALVCERLMAAVVGGEVERVGPVGRRVKPWSNVFLVLVKAPWR